MKNKEIHIRWMIRRDMREVLAIEETSFEFQWSEEDFVRCLRQRNCIGMVAEHDEQVVGFMIYELHKSRLNIINFAIRSDYRRRGVGTKMVAKLIGKLSHDRRTNITLMIDETNVDALQFFSARGFVATGVSRAPWIVTDHDGITMRYDVTIDIDMLCDRLFA